ncbi:hypothetical protein D3C87_19470 [compost metagenome]
MKQFATLFLILFTSLTSFSQVDDELYVDDEKTTDSRFEPYYEIGADIHFSAGSYGGTGGLGLKFGIVRNKYVSFGPSLRYHYSSYKSPQTGLSGSYSVYGGGAFVHARFFNYLFVGFEFEMLSNPYSYANGVISAKRVWAPTGLLGFGFSHAFGEEQNFRLNAGIMYDIIDNANSPLRTGYFMKKENGTLIPLIYRIAFFFKL